MEAVNGVAEDKGAPPPPSPLTGCYLLIVVGEPHCRDHKDIILQRVAKGLLSWDVNDCLVDLEKELAIITEQGLEGEEARYGERLIQFASENLVTEILIHPVVSTLAQCVRNLLSSFTRHRHIIHAGYTFANNGSWVLQDGTFSLADFSEAFQEIEVLRVIRAYENGISLDLHCAPEGEWTRLPKEPFTKSCKVRVNPNDVLTAGSPSISNFINYLEPFLIPAELENILESSDVVGNIRFSRPTLYVFPGGQGDAALFGINGFNMLLDGGFSRKACFWDFVRHLDRLDAVLLTRLNNSNVNGISAVLRRKRQNAVYPQIGHFFCNIQERKAILSPDGDKDKDPLLVNLLDEGQEIVSNLRHLGLTPQVCYRDSEPINLYHKVGHGTLDMYVLSPAKDSKEVREFLQKWNNNDQKLFANPKTNKDFVFPLQNLVSICALLVWQPANPEDTITRILFPGSSSQNKIFEGLDKIKSLEFIKHPVCSEKSLAPTSIIKTKQNMLDKIMQPEKKIIDNKKEKPLKPPVENNMESEMKNGEVNGVQPEKIAPVKKSDSTESEKSISKPKKIIENGEKADKIEKLKPKPKPEAKPKPRSESQQRKIKSVDKKPSPTTPKKSVEKINGEPKPKPKASPTATPAKSTKEANNRKVVESKIKTAPRREPPKPPAEKKEVKAERKPISRRPKDIAKLAGSPSKKVNGVQKPDTITKRGKLDKEGTTDSSTVSTPSADQESILKKDISKLTTDDIQNLKAQELADLKEEQEAVKEIEAVFRKGELHEEKPSDFRKIKDLSIDDKLEKEEYLIIEKTEIEQDLANEANKEEETQKIARDSEESEKQRKLSGELPTKEPEIEEKRMEIQEEVQKIIASATDIVKAKDEAVEASKEVSATSPEDKIDVSTDKKDGENDIKEIAQESQPDEKGSANIESGATTTAPTLPEDERMPLDEIKEDNGDQIIEEKHVKEDTKEKDIPVIQLPPKPFETVAKLPPVVGIRLDKQSHIRDIVKTPDEVADLPVHEEVDIDHYEEYPTSTETKTEPEESKKDDKVKGKEQKVEVAEPKGEIIKDKEVTTETIEEVAVKVEKLDDTKKTEVEVTEEKKVEAEEKVTEKDDKAVIPEDLNKKELSKSPDEEKDTDEHELEMKKEEVKEPTVIPSIQIETIKPEEKAVDKVDEAKEPEEAKADIKQETTVTKPVETTEEIKKAEAKEKEIIQTPETKDQQGELKKDEAEESVEDELLTPDSDKKEVIEKSEIEVKEKDDIQHKQKKTDDTESQKESSEVAKEQIVKEEEKEIFKQSVDDKIKTVKEDVSTINKIDEKLQKLKEGAEVPKVTVPDVPKITEEVPQIDKEQVQLVKEDATTIKKIEEKLQKLKEAEEVEVKAVSEVVTHKTEERQHAEPVVLTTDSNPESPGTDERKIEDKMDLGRKSPREREQDVAIIVASVAEVLKSDAPLEEFEVTDEDRPVKAEEEKVCPKAISTFFIEEERKIAPIHEEQEVPESKISKMIKDSNELMQATSRMIQDIKSAPKTEDTIEEETGKEEQDADGGTVHRMLVTASSEDGGEETEICPPGTIIFSKSSESSGRSSPEQSQKQSQKSSTADTFSDATVITRSAKEIPSGLEEIAKELDFTKEQLEETKTMDENEDTKFISDFERLVKEIDSIGKEAVEEKTVDKPEGTTQETETKAQVDEKVGDILEEEVIKGTEQEVKAVEGKESKHPPKVPEISIKEDVKVEGIKEEVKDDQKEVLVGESTDITTDQEPETRIPITEVVKSDGIKEKSKDVAVDEAKKTPADIASDKEPTAPITYKEDVKAETIKEESKDVPKEVSAVEQAKQSPAEITTDKEPEKEQLDIQKTTDDTREIKEIVKDIPEEQKSVEERDRDIQKEDITETTQAVKEIFKDDVKQEVKEKDVDTAVAVKDIKEVKDDTKKSEEPTKEISIEIKEPKIEASPEVKEDIIKEPIDAVSAKVIHETKDVSTVKPEDEKDDLPVETIQDVKEVEEVITKDTKVIDKPITEESSIEKVKDVANDIAKEVKSLVDDIIAVESVVADEVKTVTGDQKEEIKEESEEIVEEIIVKETAKKEETVKRKDEGIKGTESKKDEDKPELTIQEKVEDLKDVEQSKADQIKAEPEKESALDTAEEFKESLIKETETAVEDAKEKIKDVKEDVEAKVEEVKKDVAEKSASLGGILSDIGHSLIKDIKQVIEGTQKEVEEIKDTAKSKIEEMKEDLTDKKEAVVTAVEDFEKSLTQETQKVAADVDKQATEKKEKVLETAKDFEEGVIKDTAEMVQKATEEVKDTKDVVESKIEDVKETIAEQTATYRGVIEDVDKSISKDITSAVEETKKEIIDAKEATITEIEDASKKAVEKVDEKIADIKQEIDSSKETTKEIVDSGKKLLEETKEKIVEETTSQIKDVESKTEAMLDDLKSKEDDMKKGLVEETKILEDKFAEKKDEASEELQQITKDVGQMGSDLKEMIHGAVSEVPFVKKDVVHEESIKPSQKDVEESKYALHNGLETVEQMVVDVLTADREDVTDSKVIVQEKHISSTIEKVEEDIEKIVEKGVSEVKEFVDETKDKITSIFKGDSTKDKEEVLEKAAHDIEDNYNVVADMARSVIFEKCDRTTEEERQKEEKVLEKSAKSIEEDYEYLTDMAKSVTFEMCERPVTDEKAKDEKVLEKTAHDIEGSHKTVSEMAESIVFEKCDKSTTEKQDTAIESQLQPEVKTEEPKAIKEETTTELKDTPAKKEGIDICSLVEKVESDIEKAAESGVEAVKEIVEETKSTLTAAVTKESVKEEEQVKDASAKSSGKSSPEKLDTKYTADDSACKLSGKTSPALSADLAKEDSGRSTPELKDTSHMKADNQDSLLSGKSSPGLSGKSSPILSGSLSPGAKAESKDSLLSGKSSPILSVEAKEAQDSFSDKSSPEPIKADSKEEEIKPEEKTKTETLPVSAKSSPAVSGKSSPIVGSEIKDTLKDDLSEKSTPDLKDKASVSSSPSKLSEIKTEEKEKTETTVSGKSTPISSIEIKDAEKDVLSGKSTPDMKDKASDSSTLSKTSEIKTEEEKTEALTVSGKSTPLLSGVIKDTENDVPSGKSTPDLKHTDIKEDKTSDQVHEPSAESQKDIVEKAKSEKDEKIEKTEDAKVEKQPESTTQELAKPTVPESKDKDTKEEKTSQDAPTADSQKDQPEKPESKTQEAAKPILEEKGIKDEEEKKVEEEAAKSTAESQKDKDVKPESKTQEAAKPIVEEKGIKYEEEKKVEEEAAKTIAESQKDIDVKPESKTQDVAKPVLDEKGIRDEEEKKVEEEATKTEILPVEKDSQKDIPDEKKTEPPPLDPKETSEKISDVRISVKSPEEAKSESLEDTKLDEKTETKELDSIDSGIGAEVDSKMKKTEEIEKEETKASETKEDSIAGPSTTSLSPTKISTEDLHLSGKSTPDIAEVEKLKELQETLKHEKHIPGSSTPPTVPVSPIIKEISTIQAEDKSTPVKTSTVASIKDSDIRSCTPGSDDYEIGASTYSDISSGQVSRAPHLLESERIESDEDDDVPGSPMSVTSQVAHSRSSSRYDFEDERLGTKMDPMNTSFYGALPDEGELDFEKALVEHRQTRGEDLVDSASYLYEITKAKYSTPEPDLSGQSQLDQINKNGSSSLMTASFMGDLPTATTTSETKKDPFDSWGKPLGLPSPAPPNDNRGTPKKERKLPSNVSAKNKLNDDKKRAESPSKYKNKKVCPVYVDLTYVPHHGNSYYSYVDFFKRVRARYYVFSGIEPSREVYNALLEAKQTWDDKELEVTIIPTYDTDILGYWVAENEELLTKCKIDLSPSASRCTINLQDHETSCSAYRLEF